MALKGQNLRIFIGGKCVAAATSCSIELNAETSDTSTKDSTGDWAESEVTGKSWTFSTDSLYVDGTDSTGLLSAGALGLIGTTVTISFAKTQGTQNRTKSGSDILSGNAIITKVSVTAQNRQNGTVSINGTGTGALS